MSRVLLQVRYVIDFYSGKVAEEGKVVGYHLDVRPALDDWGAFVDRFRLSCGNPQTPNPTPETADKRRAGWRRCMVELYARGAGGAAC